MTEAQGVDPDLLGATTDWDVIASTLPVADILEEPDTESGAWARHALTNPVTGKMEKSAAGLFCVRGSSSGRDITPTCPLAAVAHRTHLGAQTSGPNATGATLGQWEFG